MKAKDIIKIIEEKIAPISLAESWDSPGIKTGSINTEITKVLVCLDVTNDIIDEAVQKGCNMIISHHPLLFRPVNEITDDTQGILCSAIRHNITVYAAHTNLDYAQGGINDILAETVGLKCITQSENHRYGIFSKELSLKETICILKDRLNTDCISVILPKTCRNKFEIKKAGISCGAFDGEIQWLRDINADLLITGEIKHSDAILLCEENFITVAAGHAVTEICGVKAFCERLLKEGIATELSREEFNPFITF